MCTGSVLAGECRSGGRPAPWLKLSGQETTQQNHLKLPTFWQPGSLFQGVVLVEMKDKRNTAV